jgi:hypothetical protein
MGIPGNVSPVVNIAVDTFYSLPTLPGIYRVGQTGTCGLIAVNFGSAKVIPDSEVQKSILAGAKQIQLPGNRENDPALVVYSSHRTI